MSSNSQSNSSTTRSIRIIEYRNGRPMHLYDGLEECCTIYHCHQNLIKALLYTGHPFPYLDENITFDLAPSCHIHIERKPHDTAHSRYYTFDIVPDSDADRLDGDGEERRLP